MIDPDMLADSTPAQARALLQPLVAQARIDEEAANALHAVLHQWTWQAIDQRRRDDDLRSWEELFSKIAIALADTRPGLAAAVRQMKAFLREAIAATGLLSAEKAMQRAHVAQLLQELTVEHTIRSPWVARKVIEPKLGLGPGNLTRVINIALGAKLIERQLCNDGKHSQYRQTVLGADRLLTWKAEQELARRSDIFIIAANGGTPKARHRDSLYACNAPTSLKKTADDNDEQTFENMPYQSLPPIKMSSGTAS